MVGANTHDVANKIHGLQGRRTSILCNGQPRGRRAWVVQKYTSITPKTNFQFFNACADADENLQLPGSNWDLTFSEHDGMTKVSISIYNESLERLERMIESGFREGTMEQLTNLEELLARLSLATEARQ